MTHSPFEESVAAYALGALDAEERRAFEAHLASCAQCAAELAELRRVTTGLALSADPVTPPPHLKARTIARATAQPQARGVSPVGPPPVSIVHTAPPRSSLPWLAAAASLALAAAIGIYTWMLRTEVTTLQQLSTEASASADRLRAQLQTLRQDLARSAALVSVLGAPDVVRIDLKGQGDQASAAAQVYWSPMRGVLLLNGSNLPALDRDRVFELWAIPPGTGAAPLPAGLFRIDQTGSIITVAPSATTFPAADAFAITVEPATGSTQPTLPIILIGKTKKSALGA